MVKSHILESERLCLMVDAAPSMLLRGVECLTSAMPACRHSRDKAIVRIRPEAYLRERTCPTAAFGKIMAQTGSESGKSIPRRCAEG